MKWEIPALQATSQQIRVADYLAVTGPLFHETI